MSKNKVKIKRVIVSSVLFRESLDRLKNSVLKLENAKALVAWDKNFSANHQEFLTLYNKYTALGDEGKEELAKLLAEDVELPLLDENVLKDPKLELSANDLLRLELIMCAK
jgi:hypothetical protein